jgi:outer membrane lipoprotein-sorting protein
MSNDTYCGRRFVFPALILASMAAEPMSNRLGADDTETSSAKPAIAKRVTETTRSDGVKVSSKHPLAPAVSAAVSSLGTLEKITDYSATFTKREQIKGQLSKSVMDLKVRLEPFSVYLKYTEPHAGREVLYVDGQNKGNLLVHEEGIKSLAGTLALSPTGDQVLKENRHPVTEIGMHTMLDILLKQWELEAKYSEISVKQSEEKVGDVECKVFEATHPQQRAHFKFHKTRLFISLETNLPVRLEQIGFPTKSGDTAPVVEEYTYSSIKTNIGLTDQDFDRKNKSYRF